MTLTDVRPSSKDSDKIQLAFKAAEDSSLLTGSNRDTFSMEVLGWAERCSQADESTEFVSTQDHRDLLNQMLMSHKSKDFALVGGKVCFISHL